MLTDPAEILATGAILAGLRYSNIPIRRPSYSKPTFFSLPLARTRIRPVAPNYDYEVFLEVPFKIQHIGIVNGFAVATDEVTATPLLWRWRLDDWVLGSVAVGAEVSKRTDFPLQMRKTFLAIPEQSTLRLEVRNAGAGTLTGLAAFSGWYYPDRLATEFGAEGAGRDG